MTGFLTRQCLNRASAVLRLQRLASTAATPQQQQPTPTAGPSTAASKAQTASKPLPDTSHLPPPSSNAAQQDWSRSFAGLASKAFDKETAATLLGPINPADVEIKPDGILYLPEIKYRRILNKAFGPGAWGLAPRGESLVTGKQVSREYALVANGQLVSIARGEQDFFSPDGVATATEGCKSNALMRCCKDLGIASELWDPRFIRDYKTKYCVNVWCTNVTTKLKKSFWRRRDDPPLTYPWSEAPVS